MIFPLITEIPCCSQMSWFYWHYDNCILSDFRNKRLIWILLRWYGIKLTYLMQMFPINSPLNIYLFKVNNRNTRKSCEICSKLTTKTREWRHWCRELWTYFTPFPNFSIDDFEQVYVSWECFPVFTAFTSE